MNYVPLLTERQIGGVLDLLAQYDVRKAFSFAAFSVIYCHVLDGGDLGGLKTRTSNVVSGYVEVFIASVVLPM